MKKNLLLLTSIVCFAFNGLAQCQTTVTPTVYANQHKRYCNGTPVQFIISYSGGGSNPTFAIYEGSYKVPSSQYYLSGGSNPLLIFYNNPSNYNSLEMTSSDPCASVATVSIPLQLNPIPPSIYINNSSGSSTVCSPNVCQLITTPNVNKNYLEFLYPGYAYSHFQWYKDQQPIPNATDSIYTATSTGEYYMQYVLSDNSGSSGCSSNLYDLTIVSCTSFSSNISGPNSVTTGQQNVVYSVNNQSGFSYNWVITGGTIVSGQNINAITVDWNGATPYSLSLTETNEASETKTTFMDVSDLTTGISTSLSQTGVILFPNPATDAFYIEMPESGLSVSYEILDVTGLFVASGNFTSSTNGEQIPSTFGPGLYQVILHYNNSVTIGKLSKVQ
jgi:hypothetical protein